MKDVCLNCHANDYIASFYIQYDALIDLYHEKFAKPGLELMGLAKPLLKPAKFSNKVDFTWYEIWHHEGRRARHGASMMGPDYTHWHGTYEVAKHFYSDLIPELEELAAKGTRSSDPAKKQAAEKLQQKIDALLNTDNHNWYLNKMDPAAAAERQQRLKEFQSRYH